MSDLFRLPRAVAINDAGRPYPQARAYFFLTGTSTPATTYHDALLTTPHEHPVVADSAGVFPAIYLDNTQALAFELKTSAGVLLYADDPINEVEAEPAPTSAEIAAGVTPVNYDVLSHEECGYFMPERYGVNTTPGTTVMQTGVEAAVAAAAAAGGGTVWLSDRYRMSGPLAGKAKVDIFGCGQGAALEFPDSHGILTDWLTGFGTVTYDNFQIIGASGANRVGVYQAGTLDDADELYGLTLRNLLITGWNTGVHFRTVRNSVINNCWIQHVDKGVELIGKNIGGYISECKIIHGSGGGGSGSTGLTVDLFNYTSGVGQVPSEGIQVYSNTIYGFETAVLIGSANVLDLFYNDLQASVIGLDFSTVQLVFNVVGNFFDISGASVVAGIYGRGLSAVPSTKVNLRGNGMTASGTVDAVGIKINDSGNQNQSHVTIEENYFLGFSTADIVVNNANSCSIKSNRCNSSAPTNSISVPGVAAGTVYISENVCTKAISWAAADAAAGKVVLGHNTINGTTQLNGSQEVPSVASAATLTLPLGSRDHEHFLITGTTNVTSMTTTGWIGRAVTLHFEGILTFTDGGNLALAGNFVTTSNDTITLACIGVGTWNEVGRSVN